MPYFRDIDPCIAVSLTDWMTFKRYSRSLAATRRDRQSHFLLVVHRISVFILCRFRYIANHWSKMRLWHTTRVLTSFVYGKFRDGICFDKTGISGLRSGDNVFFVLIQITNVTDERTDVRRTDRITRASWLPRFGMICQRGIRKKRRN